MINHSDIVMLTRAIYKPGILTTLLSVIFTGLFLLVDTITLLGVLLLVELGKINIQLLPTVMVVLDVLMIGGLLYYAGKHGYPSMVAAIPIAYLANLGIGLLLK